MAQGRVWVGVALVFAAAGTAAAQPPAYPGVGTGVSYGGAGYPAMVPAPMPPGPTPPTYAPQSAFLPGAPPQELPPGPSSQTLSSMTEDHGPLKDLTPHGMDLIPPPDPHGHGGHGCCGDHEIPGWMTPFVPGHRGWFTDGEFLLVRPRNTDLDYAISNQTTGLGTVGPINSLKYGLGTGLRAEVGYRYGNGNWESAFAYTYVNGGGNSTIFGGGGVLFPTLTRPGLTDRATTAQANVDLDYQLYDMLIGRRMMVDDNFAIRWIGGFRFADIRQNFNAFYDGADARNAAVNTRSRFQGFGPIVGAETILGGWHGFHLYSRGIVGLITGRDSNSLYESNDSGATTYVNTSYDVRKVVPMGSLALGGGWQYRTFSFRAGYQIAYWNGIFERPRFVDDVGQGKVIPRPSNLTLEGLFLQVGLTF